MRVALVVVGFVLFAAIGLTVLGSRRSLEPTFHGKLLDELPSPANAIGWTRELQPIADSPEMQKAVGELLSFDDGVFALYRRGNQRISIYAAYWVPGKMSHRLIAVHTPDVCWVNGGWKRVNGGVWPEDGARMAEGRGHMTDGGQSVPSEVSRQPTAASLRVQPGERRTFVMNGQTEHVVFWHLVGGKSKSYGTGHVPPWWSPLFDLWEKGLNQREEQFFVRISSNESIEAIWDTPIVQHVIVRVPGLALAEDR